MSEFPWPAEACEADADEVKNSSSPMVSSVCVYRSVRKRKGDQELALDGSIDAFVNSAFVSESEGLRPSTVGSKSSDEMRTYP